MSVFALPAGASLAGARFRKRSQPFVRVCYLSWCCLFVAERSSLARCHTRNGISRFITFSTMQYRYELNVARKSLVCFVWKMFETDLCFVDANGQQLKLIAMDQNPSSSSFLVDSERVNIDWISGDLRVAGWVGPFTAVRRMTGPKADRPDLSVISSPNSRKQGQSPSLQVIILNFFHRHIFCRGLY